MLKFLLTLLLMPGLAFAQSPAPGPGAPLYAKYQNFGGNVSGSSGNAADLLELVLPTCSFTIPANSLPNVGDVFQITLGGKFGATTDSKSVRVRLGTTIAGVPIIWTASGTVAAALSWVATIRYMKTAVNAQTVIVMANVGNGTFNGTSESSSSLVETVANQFVVTGQNTTNSVANSVTCQYMQTEYFGVKSQ